MGIYDDFLGTEWEGRKKPKPFAKGRNGTRRLKEHPMIVDACKRMGVDYEDDLITDRDEKCMTLGISMFAIRLFEKMTEKEAQKGEEVDRNDVKEIVEALRIEFGIGM